MNELENALWMLWITLGLTLEGMVLFFCYWLMPMTRRARFMSFVTKKSYGLAKVIGKGRKMTVHLVNMFDDYAKVRGGVFVLDPAFIVREDDCPVIYFDENNAFEPANFTNSGKLKSSYRTGELPEGIKALLEKAGIKDVRSALKNKPDIGRIYLQPMALAAPKSKSAVYDPQMIDNIFLKQKGLAESEAFVQFIKKFERFLLISVVASVLGLALTYMVYDVVSGGGFVKSLMGG